MCVAAIAPIIPLLTVAASVGSAVVGYQGAMTAHRAQEQQYKANAENARTAAQGQYDQINNRVIQENAAASNEIQEAQIAALKSRSSARTAAEEGGVSGVSVDAIVGEMLAKEARYVVNTQKNFDYQKDYWMGEGAAASAQAQSQVNSVQRTARPSFLPYAMQAFGSSIEAIG